MKNEEWRCEDCPEGFAKKTNDERSRSYSTFSSRWLFLLVSDWKFLRGQVFEIAAERFERKDGGSTERKGR